MKLTDVVNQLRAVLPKYTDVFSKVLSISTITVSGGTATIVTSSSHGLSTGDNIVISDVTVHTSITAVSQSGNVFTFTTGSDHDLTFGWQEHENVNLDGFTDSAWNDSFYLVDVPNRRTFKVRSTNALPVLNTNEVLLENRRDGVNGRWSATVVDPTTFTIATVELDGTYVGGTVGASHRIAGSITIERAVEQYTAQNLSDFWMFVVPDDAELSKDRATYTDAVATRTTSDDLRLRLLDGFLVYIIKNTTQDIAAVAALDICRHDLLLPVLKSLNGARFEAGLSGSGDFKTIMTSHRAFDYNRAYLIYEYQFQMAMDITNDDQVQPEDTRAFRDIDYTEEIGGDDTTDMTITIDLDEEPL